MSDKDDSGGWEMLQDKHGFFGWIEKEHLADLVCHEQTFKAPSKVWLPKDNSSAESEITNTPKHYSVGAVVSKAADVQMKSQSTETHPHVKGEMSLIELIGRTHHYLSKTSGKDSLGKKFSVGSVMMQYKEYVICVVHAEELEKVFGGQQDPVKATQPSMASGKVPSRKVKVKKLA